MRRQERSCFLPPLDVTPSTRLKLGCTAAHGEPEGMREDAMRTHEYVSMNKRYFGVISLDKRKTLPCSCVTLTCFDIKGTKKVTRDV